LLKQPASYSLVRSSHFAVAKTVVRRRLRYKSHALFIFPPNKMPSKTPSPQKQRLTLAQLTSYDDILTDALVDHVHPPEAFPGDMG